MTRRRSMRFVCPRFLLSSRFVLSAKNDSAHRPPLDRRCETNLRSVDRPNGLRSLHRLNRSANLLREKASRIRPIRSPVDARRCLRSQSCHKLLWAPARVCACIHGRPQALAALPMKKLPAADLPPAPKLNFSATVSSAPDSKPARYHAAPTPRSSLQRRELLPHGSRGRP